MEYPRILIFIIIDFADIILIGFLLHFAFGSLIDEKWSWWVSWYFCRGKCYQKIETHYNIL